MDQKIITAQNNYEGLDGWLEANGVRRPLLVCGGSMTSLPDISAKIAETERKGTTIVRFSGFHPNPSYESCVAGAEVYRSNHCDAVIAIGGGSAIDVAKCVKLFSGMEGGGEHGEYLNGPFTGNDVPFLAVPTTAGTGSEATRYAVIYYGGRKQSVSSASCIPGTVLLDPGALKTLPQYQRKATMMDALCHAIESYWSVNSTAESIEFSKGAIKGVIANMDGYLCNTDDGNAGMLMAAHTAGKAIDITQTTAGHAMCYKITGFFKVAHGHAVILCDRVLYSWMADNTDKCIDPRGKAHLTGVLNGIGRALGCNDAASGTEKLKEIFSSLELEIPTATERQYEELKTSVNPVRLKNHPIALDEDTIDQLYRMILR